MEVEADAVLRWLDWERNTQWLIIFDNVDQEVKPAQQMLKPTTSDNSYLQLIMALF